jgi:3',5'-cyclic AMP phosphodiesterase CpdA
LKIALLSDLHAHDDDPTSESGVSWLTLSKAEDPTQHPFAALHRLIEREQLSAHYVVCPGDIADKANPKAISYAWSQLQKLRSALGAQKLIATPGNHDIDSRFKYNDHDAKGYLQALVPYYPTGDEALDDRFWSRHYVVLNESPACRFLVLNSSAYHGYRSDRVPPEYEYGRVSKRTLAAIEAELSGSPDRRPVNVLVCHHHPHKHGNIDAADYSAMEDGTTLIDLLNRAGLGRWIVLHGHKHQPRLAYAAGGSRAPVVFGAGSFSAQLYAQLQGRARNQFYLIEFPWGEYERLGLELAGSFRAWDWTVGIGWQPAGPSSGLPARGGFGFGAHFPQEAKTIRDVVGGRRLVDWQDVLRARPQLEYLLPQDVRHLVEELRSVGVAAAIDESGCIAQVSSKATSKRPS